MKKSLFLFSLIMVIFNLNVVSQPKSSSVPKYSSTTSFEYNTDWYYQVESFSLFDDHSTFYKKHKKFKFTSIPGVKVKGMDLGIKIGEDKYMDRIEVTNLAYNEFVYQVRVDSAYEAMFEYLPDTTVWYKFAEELKDSYEPRYRPDTYSLLTTQYKNLPDYRYFPAVGINYVQAKSFCEWKGKMLTSHFIETNNLIIEGRLPTVEEFKEALYSEYTYGNPLEEEIGYELNLEQYFMEFEFTEDSKYYIQRVLRQWNPWQWYRLEIYGKSNKRQTYALNISPDEYYSDYIPSFGMPLYVYSLLPNKRGFYHLIGNVQEWVNDSGDYKLMGGGFLNNLDNYDLMSTYLPERAEIELYSNIDTGFRCVMEVKKDTK